MPRVKEKSSRNSFGSRLRKLRESRIWSQAVLAGKSPMIAYLESGAKKPGLETAIALAKALGVGGLSGGTALAKEPTP